MSVGVKNGQERTMMREWFSRTNNDARVVLGQEIDEAQTLAIESEQSNIGLVIDFSI